MDFSNILDKLHFTTINIIALFTGIITIPVSICILLTRSIFYKYKDRQFSINLKDNQDV
jgi:hypothetical protein